MNANLFARLLSTVRDVSDVAIIDGARSYTYGDLISLSGRLANALVGRGVKPGDRVAVQVEKSVNALALYLATVRAGAIFLPLNTAYTIAEIEYFVGDAEPSLIVCDPSVLSEVEVLAAKTGSKVETLSASGDGSLASLAEMSQTEFETVFREGSDLAAILYTSGTTGRSKGAMLSHDNLVSNALSLIDTWKFTGEDVLIHALRLIDTWKFTGEDVLIHALPIYHTHGLFVGTNVTLFSGASMIFLTKFDRDEILNHMATATVLMGVPTFYVRLLQSPRLAEATLAMRLFISGSAPLLAETHLEWNERTGHSILERYGMTETNMNTSNPYEGDRVPGTVGLPLPGVSVRITNPENDKLLDVNEIGMIEVKGPNVFQGYWRMPEKTAAELRENGFFITGDLGKIDERGYVHILGRGKDLVITGGFNVYPKEVEEEIDAIKGVFESAVIGLPHKDFGEAVTAVVVRSSESSVTEGSILEVIGERLAKFKRPKQVLFVDELPRNTMGKVQKNLLRERFKELYETPAPVRSGASI